MPKVWGVMYEYVILSSMDGKSCQKVLGVMSVLVCDLFVGGCVRHRQSVPIEIETAVQYMCAMEQLYKSKRGWFCLLEQTD